MSCVIEVKSEEEEREEVVTLDEEDEENAARLDRTALARNRSSSSLVSAVPIQKTRRVLSSAGIVS